MPRWSWTSLLLAETGRVLDWLLPIYSLGAKVELQKELMLILMLLMRLLVVATAAAVAGHPTSSSCAEPRANCEPVSANDSVLRSVTHLCASLFGIHIIFGVVMCVPTCTLPFNSMAWPTGGWQPSDSAFQPVAAILSSVMSFVCRPDGWHPCCIRCCHLCANLLAGVHVVFGVVMSVRTCRPPFNGMGWPTCCWQPFDNGCQPLGCHPCCIRCCRLCANLLAGIHPIICVVIWVPICRLPFNGVAWPTRRLAATWSSVWLFAWQLLFWFNVCLNESHIGSVSSCLL